MARKKQKKDTKVDVLGTTYTIKLSSEKEDEALKNLNGYCLCLQKHIVIDDKPGYSTSDSITKRTIRHELLHAFFYESGLDNEVPWANYEEQIVDWIALQFPKMLKAFKEAGGL